MNKVSRLRKQALQSLEASDFSFSGLVDTRRSREALPLRSSCRSLTKEYRLAFLKWGRDCGVKRYVLTKLASKTKIGFEVFKGL